MHSQRAETTSRRKSAFLWAKMAKSIREIVLAAQAHAENERVLQALRDTKQDHQDKIAALNVRINELLPIVAASKADLKAAIETF